MKKFILFFVLSLLFVIFAAFFYKVYIEQKEYFSSRRKITSTPTPSSVEEIIIPSKYLDYSKVDYDASISNKRPLVLFFTANWCSLCFDQDSINKSAFESLNKEGVTGLRIHILDSETTTETGALAKKFDVTKENTIVILDKNGAVYFKHVGNLSAELLKAKILEVR